MTLGNNLKGDYIFGDCKIISSFNEEGRNIPCLYASTIVFQGDDSEKNTKGKYLIEKMAKENGFKEATGKFISIGRDLIMNKKM